MKISITKTEIVAQEAAERLNISLVPNILMVVTRFRYVVSVLTSTLFLDEEIAARIGKAATAFGKLSARVWGNAKLKTKTRVIVYQDCVLFTLLYGSGTWTLYSKQERKLNTCYMGCLKKILNRKWQDGVSNIDILRRKQVPSIYEILRLNRLGWLGHVSRMEEERLPRQVLYGDQSDSNRPVSRPKIQFKDVCKASLRDFLIDIDSWEETTVDRQQWTALIRRGVTKYAEDMAQRESDRIKRRQ